MSQLANGDAVTLFLVHLDVLVAPEPDTISRKKCTPTVALLKHYELPYARNKSSMVLTRL